MSKACWAVVLSMCDSQLYEAVKGNRVSKYTICLSLLLLGNCQFLFASVILNF